MALGAFLCQQHAIASFLMVSEVDDLLSPCPELQRFVEGYWQRHGSYQPAKRVRVLADACTKIIFELVPMPWPSCYVIATQLTPIIVTLTGEVHRIGIRFRPGMAGFFLNRSLDGLGDRLTSFTEVSVAEGEQMLGQLREACSLSVRVHLVDGWLLSLLAAAQPDFHVVAETSRLSHGMRNGLPPPALAGLMGWPERRLQRVCRERFGATAANLHRFYRFEILQKRLNSHPVELADLAAELRFSDQAHMAREFRHFAGTTISSFLRERVDVGNVQDKGDWLPVLRRAEESGIW
ncbi:DUF6597 domain-containing transcriptional factor [Blastomonas sp.]|uniref:DUF6597 domain-containing transcriptional factor n=1 Tax=Blastomonas sp. TaxID=1909299 RepID=UPI003593C868